MGGFAANAYEITIAPGGGADGLDLASELDEYVQMDEGKETSGGELPPLSPGADRARHVAWAVALVGAALIAVLAFGAYRQPELLLNIMGLRYCG
jgi:hypothetical protein